MKLPGNIELKRGCTRMVLLIGTVAIKLPNVTDRWVHFLGGLIANINEWETWDYNGYDPNRRVTRDELLCPVLWMSWGGWILVMRRTVPHVFLNAETGEPIDYSKWVVAGYGGDDHAYNYGRLDGRIVKIDYGHN